MVRATERGKFVNGNVKKTKVNRAIYDRDAGDANGSMKRNRNNKVLDTLTTAHNTDTASKTGAGTSTMHTASKKVVNKSERPRQFKLQNVAKERGNTTDTLHTTALEPVQCSQEQCSGSFMDVGLRSTSPRPKDELLRHAEDFIGQYYTSIKKHNSDDHVRRWDAVERSIRTTGTYDLTLAELTMGAKTGWRNAPRCIGRIHWSQLQVFDARHVTTAKGMFEAICKHMRYGTNGGNLRSAITVFRQRTDGQHDFRVWNAQLIRYAGYRQDDGSVVGDPANVEITQICEKLGWRGKGTRFDVLPLVLQADGDDPELFEIPPELVLEVPLTHPTLPWFADLGLKWYALPAVSCLVFDCGGLEFTCAPFSGWYMGTEVGARDLCDKYRYDVMEEVAAAMGLDTKRNASLWRDKVLVEVNIAVLHSYQSRGVTMVDHHTVSRSFMKHLDNEQRLRGGCPADWVWVVPPMSGSILPVFHQEMLMYKLKPNYEYQEDPWKNHVWKRHPEWNEQSLSNGRRRKLRFSELAKAVSFAMILMRKVLSKRVKCTILYGTETGTSEDFAKTLHTTFKYAFDSKVLCMDEYDVSRLDRETILLVVVSTYGNGDPPGNAEMFGKALFEMKHPESGRDKRSRQTLSLRPSDTDTPLTIRKYMPDNGTLVTGRLRNVQCSGPGAGTKPLRYSVFALGSSTYPKYCAFGHYVDNILRALGASEIYRLGEGDEQCGQEEAFRVWAAGVFTAACETYGISESLMKTAVGTLSQNNTWSPATVRLTPVVGGRDPDIVTALSKIHGKTILSCKLKDSIQLQSAHSDRQTLLVKLDTEGSSELMYSPGDHLAVYPTNSANLVDRLLSRLQKPPPADQLVSVEMLNERNGLQGVHKSWEKWTKLPACSLRTAFLRYLDITTPPSQTLLKLLASLATKESDQERLKALATVSNSIS